MKLLITGATGYLGSRLVPKLLQEGHQLSLLIRQQSKTSHLPNSEFIEYLVLNSHPLEELCFKKPIDGVIHCATNYGRGDTDLHNTIAANLTLPLELLKLSIKYQVSFFLSSDTALDKRISHYSLSKSHFKDWLMFFSREITAINMELSHFYGPHDDPSKFATMVFNAFMTNTPELHLTEGEQRRRFLYIDDVVDAFMRVIQNSGRYRNGFHNLEVGSATEVSIKEFVLEVQSQTATLMKSCTKPIFGSIPYRPNETMSTSIHLEALTSLGWKESVPLKEGIRRSLI